jgi:hypothetical protein
VSEWRLTREPEHHEPLPGVTEMPRWVWRKAGRAGRVGIVVLFAGLCALAVVLAPKIAGTKRDNARTAAREDRLARARATVRIRADQRLRTARTPQRGLAATTTALDAHILRDFRRRQAAGTLAPPRVREVRCDPLPEDPGLKAGLARLKCLAVTSSTPGVVAIGYEVVGAVRPASGRLYWCKTNPEAGEKANGVSAVHIRLATGCFGGLRPGEHPAEATAQLPDR